MRNHIRDHKNWNNHYVNSKKNQYICIKFRFLRYGLGVRNINELIFKEVKNLETDVNAKKREKNAKKREKIASESSERLICV